MLNRNRRPGRRVRTPEQEALRQKHKAENRKARKLQNRGATPVRGFDPKTGKIRLGLRWVNPEPWQGYACEVRASDRPGYFLPTRLKAAPTEPGAADFEAEARARKLKMEKELEEKEE